MTDPSVFVSAAEMTAQSRSWAAGGQTVAVVPTMGALHEGHRALMREARRRADRVVVTVFVNPTQFDRSSDLDSYPRDLEADLACCSSEDVDAVFAPTIAEVYPAGATATVSPGPIAERLEGAHRPGHFTGVATVVLRLFEIVLPGVAVFGEKDAQQLAVIRSVCAEHEVNTDIVGVPTVREADGLALSSRNVRLSRDAREAAVALPGALRSINEAWRSGERSPSALRILGHQIIEQGGGECDYVDLVDPRSFITADPPEAGDLIVAAAWFGGIRLIDNLELSL